MKKIIFALAISVVSLAACNSDGSKSNKENELAADTTQANTAPASPDEETKSGTAISGIVNNYLQLKNALANDESKAAATAGSEMITAFKNFDKSSLSSDNKKMYEDIKDDAIEHVEHISMNGDNIKHQREHFETLSKDMYDLVKTFGAGQTLYQDYCPMYNDNNGAAWLSETKEIQNPYLGKNMPACGEIKEEIKK